MIARKFFLYISFLCFIILFFPVNAKAQLSLSLPDVSGTVGGTISIPIDVSEITEDDPVTSFQFNIEYDPDVIFLTGNVSSGIVAANQLITNPDLAPGKMRIAFASAGNITGSGVLLYFEAELLTEGESPLTWDDTRFFDDQGEDIILDLTNGSVTVADVPPLQAPELTNPSNGATNVSRSPSLMWEDVDEATSYNVQLALDNGFSNLIVDQSNVSNSFLTVTGLDYETTYYWRVNSENSETVSEWSDVWSFTTMADPGDPPDPEVPGQVELAYPEDGATFELEDGENDVELGWEIVGKASKYQLDVATDANFNNLVFTYDQVIETTHLLEDVEHQQNYYWRVRAGNSEGWGEYSDVWSFSTLIVGVEDEYLTQNFKLDQNYPNPFNPSTTISYTVPEQSSIKLEIFDALGRYITTLVDGQQASGSYDFEWHPKDLSSGIYLYRLEAVSNVNQFIEVKSMILMK